MRKNKSHILPFIPLPCSDQSIIWRIVVKSWTENNPWCATRRIALPPPPKSVPASSPSAEETLSKFPPKLNSGRRPLHSPNRKTSYSREASRLPSLNFRESSGRNFRESSGMSRSSVTFRESCGMSRSSVTGATAIPIWSWPFGEHSASAEVWLTSKEEEEEGEVSTPPRPPPQSR